MAYVNVSVRAMLAMSDEQKNILLTSMEMFDLNRVEPSDRLASLPLVVRRPSA